MITQKNFFFKKKQILQLTILAVLMLAGMSLYEALKQILFPEITIWQSHLITIVFSTLCATVAGFFILRKYIRLTDTLTQKNKESEALAEELEITIEKLKLTLSEIKTLTGLIPICSYCKKIRDDEGNWIQLEKYIREHSDAEFSHGLCVDCAKKMYPNFFDCQPDEEIYLKDSEL